MDAFAQTYFSGLNLYHKRTHAKLQADLQPAVQRYRTADETVADEFRDKLHAFCKLYAFLSQIIPYGDSQLEKLSLYGKFLLPYLRTDRRTEPIDIANRVDIESYRLQRKWYGGIEVEGDATVRGVAEAGSKYAMPQRALLSEMIEILNEQHGMNLGEDDRLFFQQTVAKATNDEQFGIMAASNEYDKFELAIGGMIDNIMVRILDSNGTLVNKYMTDTDAKRDVFPVIARSIFDKISETPQLDLV